jgi:hypothetical protein
MKKKLFITILVVITLTAHPIGLFSYVGYFAWPVLTRLGIDVYFQPITYDMPALYDSSEDVNFYTKKASFYLKSPQGIQEISFDQLGIYQYRIPLMSLIEDYYFQQDVRLHISAICHELKKINIDTQGFKLNLDGPKKTSKQYGFNMGFLCQKQI